MAELHSLEGQIAGIFEQKLNLVVPSVDTDLFATGGLDSLSFVALLVQFEEEFGVKVSLEDLELDNFRSISRIAEFIVDRTGQKGAKPEGRAAIERAPSPRPAEHG